jgi:phosphoribosylformylglycinamidine cyclo-ligase
VNIDSWDPGPVFGLLARESGLGRDDLYETLNMGVGMIAIVRSESVNDVLDSVAAEGTPGFVCGEILGGSGVVRLESPA